MKEAVQVAGGDVVSAVAKFRRDPCFDRAAVIACFALLSFLPLVAAPALSGRGGSAAAQRGSG